MRNDVLRSKPLYSHGVIKILEVVEREVPLSRAEEGDGSPAHLPPALHKIKRGESFKPTIFVNGGGVGASVRMSY